MCAHLQLLTEHIGYSHAQSLSLAAQGGVAFSKTLQVPTPFAAADVISHDDEGHIEYHYTIVEVTVKFVGATNEGSWLSTLHVGLHGRKQCIGCSRA